MNFEGKNVHFIGIGGIGMSGLAKVLLMQGAHVTGSDICPSAVTGELTSLGAGVTIGHSPDNLSPVVELVVHSAAIKPDNPEYQKASRRGLAILKYAQLLGVLMADYVGIAVSGTHGKSTTTAMITYILKEAGYAPSFVIGARVPQLGAASSDAGAGEHLVAEACEYDRSFHNLSPTVAVINNIEEDHLDYYHNLDEIVESFKEFTLRIKPGGILVANLDDARVSAVAREAACDVITVGTHPGANWQAHSMTSQRGSYSFQVRKGSQELGAFSLSIPGVHHVSNALAALATCDWVGVELEEARFRLGQFAGTERRFQILGEVGGVTVVDDYAHHPTEIRCTLKAAREFFPGRKIWCVFQPHQHSRTRFLLSDFAHSFAQADEIVLADIYFVRDSLQEKTLISSRDLVREVTELGGHARYFPSFPDITDCLGQELEVGDVLVTMGAGDIWQVAYEMFQRLKGGHDLSSEPGGADLVGCRRSRSSAAVSPHGV